MNIDQLIREQLVAALQSPEGKAAIRAALVEALPVATLAPVLPMAAPDQRLKTRHAAQLADCHPDTIRRAIADGDLKASKPKGSREYLIVLGDLRRWMEERGKTRGSEGPVDLRGAVDQAVRHLRG